jgi:site-specific DNA-methyltransferase (adenine-specific)
LSTGENEHPTPQWLFDKINDMFNFEIDLSATSENAKCEKFYTKEQDALKYEWDNTSCWCNPPYSKDLQPLFIQKAYTDSLKYKNTIVLLIPLRADTRVWHDYIWGKADVYIFKGRPKFYGDKSPTYASALVVYSDSEHKNIYTVDKDFEAIKQIA